MQTYSITDFSAGWIPSDHSVKGRKNGLLRMDSLELDNQGAVVMTRGTKNWNATNYGADAHSLYNAFLSGNRTHYLALTDNKVYRDTTNIFSSGSTVRAGFCKAFDYIWIWSGAARKRDDGTTVTSVGLTTPAAPATSLNGAGILTGDYDYAVIEVFNSGSAYYAKSAMSTLPSTLSAAANKISVDPATPTSPANEAWVYRRGGTMDNWYRIAIRTSGTGFAAFDDNMSDQDAIELNETANVYYSPTNSTGITDDILEALALVNGRMILFTKKNIHFSLINSPDSYDTRTSLGSASSAYNTGSEIFLFAKKVAENVILVGTTADVYLLTGTYIQLPNGTLDIYFRSLSVHNPPISIDADVYNNQLVYMSKSGWVLCNLSGATTPLIYPNVDTLYRGNTVYSNKGVPIFIYPSLRYSCAVAKEKLWCRVPQIESNDPSGGVGTFTYRMDVYDFIRKYWRSMQIAPLIISKEDDDAITGFFNDSARNLRLIDNPVFSGDDRTLKGPSGTKQTVNFLTGFYDFDATRNRKECFNLKFKINTNSENLTYNVYTNDTYGSVVATGTINTGALSEVIIDVHTSIGKIKSFAIGLTGAIGSFELADISMDYELLPTPVTYMRIPAINFGTFAKKRIPDFGLIIDTLGSNVTLTIFVDGISITTATITTSYKASYIYDFTANQLGTDLELTLSGTNPFEFYDFILPKNLELFPELVRFFTLPATSLGSFGSFARKRIYSQGIRLRAPANTTVTYTPYVDGVAQTASSFSVTTDILTFVHYFTTEVIGSSFFATLSASAGFEIWEVFPPKLEEFPLRCKFFSIPITNFGNAAKKRVRTLPFIIDLLGGTVTFSPTVDGSAQTGTAWSGTGRQVLHHFFNTDVFGIDYGGTLSSTTAFELYDIMSPEIVQVLPVAKQFDQIGPAELFKYGKIRKIEFRLIAFSGTTIPYAIYEQDTSVATGNIVLTASKESVEEISLPKGVYGSILRIELGPTSFNFHRMYTRIAVALSGKDTELVWKTLEAEPNG